MSKQLQQGYQGNVNDLIDPLEILLILLIKAYFHFFTS